MPDKFIIEGENRLKGSIEVKGSKNSATPILAATLLTKEPCIIDNLPLIEDVLKMIKLISDLGAKVTWIGERKIKIEAKDIDPSRINKKLVLGMRSSILIMGPLLARCGKVEMNHPGGCIIGTRSIKTHLEAFKDMGADIEISQVNSYFDSEKKDVPQYSEKTNLYSLNYKKTSKDKSIVLDEFSVTGTENILMALSLNPGKSIIKIAAAEPHVQELASFLKKMGAEVKGEGTNTIEITGKENLSGAEHFISHDYLEAGTYILLVSTVGGEVEVKNVPIGHMDLFFKKLKALGGNFEILNNNSVVVKTPKKLKAVKIQALHHPGIPTDLQSAFGVLSTQAEGLSLIHDPLYDGRLKYLEELNKMGAEIIICDPHRAVIDGPTQLHGTELATFDLRGGAALIIAGLAAKGITVIKNISQVDRGYEKIEKRLQNIGANIKRVNN